jgi:hypothetical protein
MIVTRLQIGVARPRPGAYPMVSSSLAHAWQFHSFIGVNPLQTTWLEHGIVSGRVALLLRSAEIQPAFGRFSDWTQNPITPPHTHTQHTSHTQQRCPAARGRRILCHSSRSQPNPTQHICRGHSYGRPSGHLHECSLARVCVTKCCSRWASDESGRSRHSFQGGVDTLEQPAS